MHAAKSPQILSPYALTGSSRAAISRRLTKSPRVWSVLGVTNSILMDEGLWGDAAAAAGLRFASMAVSLGCR